MSMGGFRSSRNSGDEVTGILLRICGQMLGFGLALSAFALWLMPGAAEGLSLGRLMASLGLLLTGVSAVLLCEDRR